MFSALPRCPVSQFQDTCHYLTRKRNQTSHDQESVFLGSRIWAVIIQNGQSVPIAWSSRDVGLSFVMSSLNLPATVERQHTEPPSLPCLSSPSPTALHQKGGRTGKSFLLPEKKFQSRFSLYPLLHLPEIVTKFILNSGT